MQPHECAAQGRGSTFALIDEFQPPRSVRCGETGFATPGRDALLAEMSRVLADTVP